MWAVVVVHCLLLFRCEMTLLRYKLFVCFNLSVGVAFDVVAVVVLWLLLGLLIM